MRGVSRLAAWGSRLGAWGPGAWALGLGACGQETAFAEDSARAGATAAWGLGLAASADAAQGPGAAVPPPAAEAGTVALVAPDTCELGAQCAIALRLTCPPGSRCEFDTPGRVGGFEVLHVDTPPAGATGSLEWRLTVVAFEPGAIDVPAMTVRVVRAADGSTSVLESPTARVEVPLVAAADDATLRPDAAPLDPGPDWRMVAAWALGALVMAAVVAGAWRWWRGRARPAGAAPAVSAATAIAAIRAAATAPAATPADVLARYTAISDALRGYLGLPLDVPAEALTSTELLRAIDGVWRRRLGGGARPGGGGRADSERHEQARALLVDVDVVKFGGARPGDDVRADHGRRAVALIEALERATAPAPGGRDVA